MHEAFQVATCLGLCLLTEIVRVIYFWHEAMIICSGLDCGQYVPEGSLRL